MAASGAPALALKAAIVTTVLAVLILPSSSRCQSLGPENPPVASPPPPPPAPAPAPWPPVPCSDCSSRCDSECAASVPPQCSDECDHPYCEECKSEFIPKCEADCCVHGGGCNTCNCNGATADQACFGACSDRSCQPCLWGRGQSCRETCNKDCAATCF